MRTIAAIALAAVLAACSAGAPTADPPESRPAPAGSSARGRDAAVVRVVDGDTIVVAIGAGRSAKVRLIGIDTPERDECMYREATERLRALVAGTSVRLVRDVSETDRYGRLLRYVYARDSFVNAMMVSEGFAAAATYPPDVAHALQLAGLERVARLAKRGLWSGRCGA
jgi:micrococcal nuclease